MNKYSLVYEAIINTYFYTRGRPWKRIHHPHISHGSKRIDDEIIRDYSYDATAIVQNKVNKDIFYFNIYLGKHFVGMFLKFKYLNYFDTVFLGDSLTLKDSNFSMDRFKFAGILEYNHPQKPEFLM